MKNARSSLDSLSGSPYLPTKTKTSQTPLKAQSSSKSLHHISGSKTTISSNPKPQMMKSPTKSQTSLDKRVNATPIKNLKGVAVKKENSKVGKDSSIHYNILNSPDISMTKEELEEVEVKEDNYIYVCDDYNQSRLSGTPDIKYLRSASKQTEKSTQQSSGKSSANKTKIIDFNGFQSPQQEQGFEVSNFEDAYELTKLKVQTIKSEKIIEKGIKERVFSKQGYLMKRPLIPLGWERIFFRVEGLKLYYAQTQEFFEAKLHVKCLNLLSNSCEVIVDEKGHEFSIVAQGLGSVLSLKANSSEEANEWISFLRELFSLAQKKVQENKKYIPSQEVFIKSDVILEEEFLASIDTGDILLLKADHFAAKMQRIFTVSEYDHLALILRNKNEIFLYDSTTDNGVQLMSWQDFKQNGHHLSYSTMAYRKLDIIDEKLKDEVKQKLWEFVTLHVGKKYELNFKKLFRRPSFSDNETARPRGSIDLNTTLDGSIPHDNHLTNVHSMNTFKSPSLTSLYRDSDEGFFCSELVAAAYKFSGLLDANISSTRYLPVSFSQRRELGLLGSTLSNEYGLVLLKEH